MADTAQHLLPTTALGAMTPKAASFGVLTLTENDRPGLASLTLRNSSIQPSIGGLALPGPGCWAKAGEFSAMWIAQQQWLIEGEDRADTDFAAELSASCPGCSITEQTDGFVLFEIASSAGPQPITDLLSRLVNLDLSDFGAGRATRTGLEHMTVFVIRRAEDRAAIAGMRSTAASLWHALVTAASRLERKA